MFYILKVYILKADGRSGKASFRATFKKSRV
jgi:hypothetical protein